MGLWTAESKNLLAALAFEADDAAHEHREDHATARFRLPRVQPEQDIVPSPPARVGPVRGVRRVLKTTLEPLDAWSQKLLLRI